jgi:membrane protein
MKRLTFKDWLSIFKDTFKKWWDSDPFRQSAIIAYYAIFSIPVLLVIIIYLAGIAFGDAAVSGRVANAISDTLGQDTALQIQNLLVKTIQTKNSLLATILGISTLAFGATGVFIELQKSLNLIWQVKHAQSGTFIKSLKDRLLSFSMIASIGFLLAVSFVITTLLTVLSGWIGEHYSTIAVYVLHGINIIFSLFVISVLFAFIFKVLPDTKTYWRPIWPGAILTAILFIIGKYALEYYFVKFQPASIYGAAGSIVLILLWVSYSCMILFFGAEFTKQFSLRKHGTHKSST